MPFNFNSPCFKNGITHFSSTTFPAELDELSSLLNESDVSTRNTKWIGSSLTCLEHYSIGSNSLYDEDYTLMGSLQWASSVIIRSFNLETVWIFNRALILKIWVEPVGRLSTQIWSIAWCRFILKCWINRYTDYIFDLYSSPYEIVYKNGLNEKISWKIIVLFS